MGLNKGKKNSMIFSPITWYCVTHLLLSLMYFNHRVFSLVLRFHHGSISPHKTQAKSSPILSVLLKNFLWALILHSVSLRILEVISLFASLYTYLAIAWYIQIIYVVVSFHFFLGGGAFIIMGVHNKLKILTSLSA